MTSISIYHSIDARIILEIEVEPLLNRYGLLALWCRLLFIEFGVEFAETSFFMLSQHGDVPSSFPSFPILGVGIVLLLIPFMVLFFFLKAFLA